MRRFTIVILSSFFCLYEATAQNDWLATILTEIETNNTQLKSLRQSGQATVAEAQAANVLGETSVEYTPFFQKGADGIASSELVVSQEFDFPTLYSARRKQALAKENVCQSEYEAQRNAILLEAMMLCHDLVAAEHQSTLLGMRMAAADSLVSICERRMRLGTATIMEQNRVRTERMQIATECARNQGQVDAIVVRLKSLGMTELPVMPRNGIDAKAACERLMHRADVAQAQASLAESEQDVKVAQQEWLPRLSVGYRRNTELREYALNGVLVGVSMPLFSNGKKVRAARQRQEAMALQLADAESKAYWRAAELKTRYEDLTRQIATFDEPLMEQSLSTLLRAVSAGQMSVAEYYTEADRIYAMMQTKADMENEQRKIIIELNTL